MRTNVWLLGAVSVAFWAGSVIADPVAVSSPDGCPSVVHAPLVTVVRGTPAVITAKIGCETGTVREAHVFVRLADVGKPISFEMKPTGSGLFETTLPVSIFEGITRFWYYLDARGRLDEGQPEDGIVQTGWYPVTVVDVAAPTHGGGAAGEESASRRRAVLWVLGGAAAAAGAVVVEHNQHSHHSSAKPASSDEPVVVQKPPSSHENDEQDEPADQAPSQSPVPTPGPCVLTGAETVDFQNTTTCNNRDIEIRVCNTCDKATIEVSANWGASDQATGYSGQSCSPSAPPALTIPKTGHYTPNLFTITVRANGQTIASVPWPAPADLLGCP